MREFGSKYGGAVRFTVLGALLLSVLPASVAAFRDKVRLLWFGVGTIEANFHNRAKEGRAQFENEGIPSGYSESPGTPHEFQTWRRCLHEFAPLLFRTKKK